MKGLQRVQIGANACDKQEILMNIRKSKLVGTTLVAAAAVFVLTAQSSIAAGGSAANKLEGAWIAKVQGAGAPVQWSYVLSPDASGRSASIHGSIDVGGVSPLPADRSSPLIGEVVMTGPNTGKFTSMWYGISETPAPHIVYIGMNNGDIVFVDPAHVIGTSNIVFYLPSADANGDGIPDSNAVPLAPPTTLETIDTRLPPPQ
jgi:hypothetical protein